MIRKSDISLAARIMIREYSEEALAMSEAKANKYWDAGDDEGAATWIRIARAIEELQKVRPGQSDRTH